MINVDWLSNLRWNFLSIIKVGLYKFIKILCCVLYTVTFGKKTAFWFFIFHLIICVLDLLLHLDLYHFLKIKHFVFCKNALFFVFNNLRLSHCIVGIGWDVRIIQYLWRTISFLIFNIIWNVLYWLIASYNRCFGTILILKSFNLFCFLKFVNHLILIFSYLVLYNILVIHFFWKNKFNYMFV